MRFLQSMPSTLKLLTTRMVSDTTRIGQEKAAKLKITAELAVLTPLGLWNLQRPMTASPILADAISAELAIPQSKQRVRRTLVKHSSQKAPAEKVLFKCWALRFAVNGFWGWAVWMLFFSGGYLHVSDPACIHPALRSVVIAFG